MIKIAFFDAKPYDKIWFDKCSDRFDMKIKYYDSKLTDDTAYMAKDCDAVCAFVNDTINKDTILTLEKIGIKLIAMRCAGYNNIDLKAAYGKMHIVRVPAYSPYAVAEHGIGMLLCLNRKLHKAYIRTRDYNFSLNGMTGFDLFGKTVGIVGTGKIGRVFADICRGFGMKIIAYDPYPSDERLEYVDFDYLCRNSDIISLHCPLTRENTHLVNKNSIEKMKDGVCIINTSRGALIDSDALIDGLKSGKIGNAALDVYEEEGDVFFEDMSEEVDRDEKLAILLSMPNVIITSHQAFLTNEALENIAEITLDNIKSYFDGEKIKNEIFYKMPT
ncbi:MAG: 2-hydroxyacid dehydrogenase [Ruminococcaceae bacterium]|nr:2-hydroxyacid dehydrogenase [Oscillospiraceae bacterium]